MPVEAVREVPPEAANALVAHLRQNPDDARRDPVELAKRLGLDPAFVESVLDAVRPPKNSGDAVTLRISLRPLILAFQRGLALFDRLTERPLRFVLVTFAFCFAFTVAMQFFADNVVTNVPRRGLSPWFGSGTFVILLTGLLHMVMYLRKGMTRYPLYGGLALWIGLSGLAGANAWSAAVDHTLSNRVAMVVITSLGMMMLSLVYTGMGALMAVFGGWIHFQRKERREERMSRQDLLERYFELQTRLRDSERGKVRESAWEEWPGVRAFQSRPFLYAAFLGLLMSTMLVLTTGPLNVRMSNVPQRDLFVLFLLAVTGTMRFLAYIAIGFLSGGVRRGFVAAMLAGLGSALPMLIPIGQFGPTYYGEPGAIGEAVLDALSMSLVAMAAALGAKVQSLAHHESNLRRNDRATLTAEMLRIQWRLSDGATDVCVMVVDAARSSEMKAAADPLTVEYSFREYQDWIEATSTEFGGRVHATAGDGAVVAFTRCKDAYHAARRLQTDLSRFNRDVNRLPHPFRLRIGLHVGHVAGDLDEVEFTEVIDIAAHVQGAAPISGIALSDSVAANLPEEEVVPLSKTIDNHKVFLALNPVED